MRRVGHDAWSLGVLTLVMAGCGDPRVVGTEGGSSSSASESDTSYEASPPDLGPGTEVCGTAEDFVSTDEGYASVAGCDVFLGRVAISYPDGTNLSLLSSLRVIGDSLTSTDNRDLENLEGLEQLEWVGTLGFYRDGLVTLGALSRLAGVDDHFEITSQRELTSLHGLEALATIGGSAWLHRNEELMSLDGLSGVTWIGGDLWIDDNDKLTNLAGLSSLERVDGDLTIRGNDLLPTADVDALLGRVQVGGEIILE